MCAFLHKTSDWFWFFSWRHLRPSKVMVNQRICYFCLFSLRASAYRAKLQVERKKGRLLRKGLRLLTVHQEALNTPFKASNDMLIWEGKTCDERGNGGEMGVLLWRSFPEETKRNVKTNVLSFECMVLSIKLALHFYRQSLEFIAF